MLSESTAWQNTENSRAAKAQATAIFLFSLHNHLETILSG